MPQAHDIGHAKRTTRTRAERDHHTKPTPDQYARELVRRGLASKNILEGVASTPRASRPHGREAQ